MSLIVCPECQSKISEYAEWCPHCGCPKTIIEHLIAEQLEKERIFAEQERLRIQQEQENERIRILIEQEALERAHELEILQKQEEENKLREQERRKAQYLEKLEMELSHATACRDIEWSLVSEKKDTYNKYLVYQTNHKDKCYAIYVEELFYEYENKKRRKIVLKCEYLGEQVECLIDSASKLFKFFSKAQKKPLYEVEQGIALCVGGKKLNEIAGTEGQCLYCKKFIAMGNACDKCRKMYGQSRSMTGERPSYDPLQRVTIPSKKT